VALDGPTARRAYLVAASVISLLVVLFGAANLIAILVEVFAYPPPQPYPVPQYYPDLPASAAQVAVGLVVWGYHWVKLQVER
jgi:hypothetical protein